MRSCAAALLLAVCCSRAAAVDLPAASAHEPRYDDPSLWPHLRGDEPFTQQDWPEARLLVWDHPGVKASDKKGRLDPKDPANWIDARTGEPATALPDERTDVVFTAGTDIWIKRWRDFSVRHMTIEPDARVHLHHGNSANRFFGNVWIKEGGQFYTMGITVTGGQHAFLRNDNLDPPTRRVAGFATADRRLLAYWIVMAKGGGSSLWLLGHVGAGDELKFNEGLTVVGPHSAASAGRPSIQIVGPEAVLELQSGARFGKRVPKADGYDILVQGELRAGSPERPLTGDAFLYLNGKEPGGREGGMSFDAVLQEADRHSGRVNDTGRNPLVRGGIDRYALVVAPQGRIRVHSADPASARLVMTWNGHGSIDHVRMLFLGDVQLDGALFDHVEAGGIQMLDPAQAESWTGVSWGPENAAPPAELIVPYRH